VSRRLAGFVLAAALVAGVASVSAGAAPSQRPAGSPDLAAMTLAPTDFSGTARVVRERYYRDRDFVASYERELSLRGTRVGRSAVLFAFNGLNVEPNATEASATFGTLRRLLRTKAFRSRLAGEIARSAGIEAKSVVVGRPRTARFGSGAVSLAAKVRAQGLAFQAAMTFLRVDRLLSTIVVVSSPGRRVYARDVDRLSNRSVQRIRGGLVPRTVAAPVVSGSATLGATLSTTRGAVSGDQIVFSYQWERCTGPGIECSPIPNATSATYTVVEGDLGSSLRATVKGGNRLGFVVNASLPTDFVTGPPGSPVVVTGLGPTVDGTVAPGATLTATPGSWTGNPTSFAYQWRRCRPMTGCVDVPGATATTYTLAPADSGATIRVHVVATNAAGSGGALSPPSAPAP
jgi:hypothetical protein